MIYRDIKFYLTNNGFSNSVFNLGFWSLLLYRLGHSMNGKFIYKLFFFWYAYIIARNLLIIISKIELPPSAKIGTNLNLVHSYGLVMGDKVIIGDNVTIGPWVVLGHNGKRDKQPEIGNGVYVGSKASILGGIKIGDFSIVSTNAVVTIDIPERSIVKPAYCQISN